MIKDKPDLKSVTLGNLSFGSQISVINKEDDWYSFQFYAKNKTNLGYVYSNHLNTLHKEFKESWIDLAENFINVPYKWVADLLNNRLFFLNTVVNCSKQK